MNVTNCDWSVFKRTIDIDGQKLDTKVFGHLLRLMDKDMRANKKSLAFYISSQTAKDYERFLDSRSTVCRCNNSGKTTITPFGVELARTEVMPNDKIVLTFKGNIILSGDFWFLNFNLVCVAFNFSRG